MSGRSEVSDRTGALRDVQQSFARTAGELRGWRSSGSCSDGQASQAGLSCQSAWGMGHLGILSSLLPLARQRADEGL